jgi:hypothetical protein
VQGWCVVTIPHSPLFMLCVATLCAQCHTHTHTAPRTGEASPGFVLQATEDPSQSLVYTLLLSTESEFAMQSTNFKTLSGLAWGRLAHECQYVREDQLIGNADRANPQLAMDRMVLARHTSRSAVCAPVATRDGPCGPVAVRCAASASKARPTSATGDQTVDSTDIYISADCDWLRPSLFFLFVFGVADSIHVRFTCISYAVRYICFIAPTAARCAVPPCRGRTST